MYVDSPQDSETACCKQALDMSRFEHPNCFINIIKISLKNMRIFAECFAPIVLKAL